MPTRTVFISALLIALGYALFTDRVWEDYLITYKSSKNLVQGHGLVFHPGEKVHTFTSPLGVLLPAACLVIAPGGADDVALWVFRLLSASAFAGAVALMFRLGTAAGYGSASLLALACMTDAKSVDFSINGMETGFLLFFLAYMLWSLLKSEQKSWLHLGIAWGGLMWTRPDGVIYIAVLVLSTFLFSKHSGRSPVAWFRLFLQAGAVCTVIYLPWFITAWVYYGTPVPHTITAKANAVGSLDFWGVVLTWLRVQTSILMPTTASEALFMPSANFLGGWPSWLPRVSASLSWIAAVAWVWRGFGWQMRALSFCLGLLLTYLTYFAGQAPASWYLPGPTLIALFILSGMLGQLRYVSPRLTMTLTAMLLGLGTWMLIEVAALSKVEQKLVDEGNRKVIGEWLRDNATPGDTMFMECLGYLGYYSGLKTYDFPGMSSPEVVAASRKRKTIVWDALIQELRPTWLVLRPIEADRIIRSTPQILTRDYEEIRVFDVSDQVQKLNVYGQGLLAFDSTFIIFRRVAP
ncbi:MAG: hypothetical protein JNJ83_03605 [Verrucomicrobiaceae bacterium]|nr:hypothetical protein [Verrucomicrobiaceae bacterium]